MDIIKVNSTIDMVKEISFAIQEIRYNYQEDGSIKDEDIPLVVLVDRFFRDLNHLLRTELTGEG